MGRAFKLGFCVVVAAFLFRKVVGFPPSTLGLVALSTAETNPDNPCLGKRRCLVVFVTPWCPACHASVPFVQAVRGLVRQSADLGMQVVIGSDQASALQEMGQEIGEPVYYDPPGSMQAAMGGGGVPRWAVIDSERKVLDYGSGLPGVDDSHPGFRDFLKAEMNFY